MRTFILPRCPYDRLQVYKKSTVEIKPGVTILVGCNGSGKSTMLAEIKGQLEKENIPCLSYNNLHDGRNKMQLCLASGEMEKMALLTCSSEGEQIIINMNDYSRDVIEFVKNKGKLPNRGFDNVFAYLLQDETEENETDKGKEPPKEYWFVLDAIGSGLSIDNIIALRESFDQLCSVFPKSLTPYVIIAANDYEFCVGEQCFSVQDGKYVDIASYEDFKKLIFKTRKWKDDQYRKRAKKGIEDT